MNYDATNRTFDCEPTLTDFEVLDFCINGYIMLEGVVPDDVNRRACDYLDGRIPANPAWIPEGLDEQELERIRNSHEPSSIFLEDWYLEHVLLNPVLCGVMRSLLGRTSACRCWPACTRPRAARAPGMAPGRRPHLRARARVRRGLLLPQDTPAELGPTEFVPGTHFRMQDYQGDFEGVLASGPAGTIGIHHQSILHRRGESTKPGGPPHAQVQLLAHHPSAEGLGEGPGVRLPRRLLRGHNVARYAAHMFYWLCGKGEEYRIVGGQGWPWRTENQIGPSWGYGRTEGYLPDWRDGNRDGYSR